MIASTTSLAVTPAGERAVDGDRHRARPRLREGLGGQDVLDLARADAERQRAERAVGRRVAVAAHDGEPGLRQALLGSDHVHDALARLAHRIEPDTELGAVGAQDVHLLGRDRILDRLVEIGGGDVVVHRGHGEIGTADGAPGETEPVERLRRRDLVDEVQVDIEEVGFAITSADDVALPDLFREGVRRGGLRHAPILPGECWTARMRFSPSNDVPTGLRMGTAAGRWVIAAAVLGSGLSFLDGTVVNAALPTIAHDLGADLGDLQWVLTGYLLTLGSLLVLGGSLGDRFGRRRVFLWGLVAFAATSTICSIAPTTSLLIAARCVQGVGAALVVPNSLAIVSASFCAEDRGRAIGAWSGLAGIATALGPFLGGWLIDAASWRFAFVLNLPLALAAGLIALHHVPETRDEHASRHLDVRGSALLSLGLAGVAYALIEGPAHGWNADQARAGRRRCHRTGLVRVRRSAHRGPMVPLRLFRSRQFSGTNAVTFAVYSAMGAVTFLLVVHLQTDLGYSALEAGASLLPITVLMLLFSARAGALAQRIGPRLPMTVGPLVVAAGMALFARVDPGTSYWATVLPAALVLGAGLALTVAPLTANRSRRGRRRPRRHRVGHQQRGGAHRGAARGGGASRCGRAHRRARARPRGRLRSGDDRGRSTGRLRWCPRVRDGTRRRIRAGRLAGGRHHALLRPQGLPGRPESPTEQARIHRGVIELKQSLRRVCEWAGSGE